MKKMYKGFTLFALLVVSAIILAACGGSETESGEAAEAETYTMVLTNEVATTHAKHLKMEELAKMIEEKSGGRIKTEIYPSKQLYTDADAVSSLGSGSVHMAWPPTAQLEKINEEVGVVGLPFSLRNDLLLESVDYKNDLNDLLSGFLNEKNIKHLGILRATGGVIITTKKEIKDVKDFENLKLSIAGGQTQINIMSDIGANAISMPISEAPTSLAQGVVDGVFTSPNAWSTGIGDIGKYGTIIEGFVPMTYSMVIDGKWFDQLPKDLQDVIVEASNEVVNSYAQNSIDADAKEIEVVKEYAQITEFTEDQIAEIKEMVQPSLKDFEEKFPEAYEKFKAIDEKY
ncbi:TRAP transporter substrate-binding protein [Lysinibacillus endophyticus]|uniref:TRAP transporter substrate-binding protein n=1 Tax=Ureibacillus endophyticus TaxID=1978490 RepID=UPI0020A0DBB2|nr:TRAP transporter substrate-binding protein DctP [Lysinibacillus endophyticus]MCP1146218.1 TRAP transporter substrate-binding protein DctP [Lysinibacillus endophyticus]